MVDELRAAAGRRRSAATADAARRVAADRRHARRRPGRRAGDAACAGAPLWRCIGEHAGDAVDRARRRARRGARCARRSASSSARPSPWRRSPTPSPATSARPASRSSTCSDPAFIAWLRRLAGAVDASPLSAGTPLATMAIAAGALDVAATTDAERSAARCHGDRFDANYPEPSMWVEAVLAVPDGTAVPDDVAGDRRRRRSPAPAGSDPSTADAVAAERLDDARPARRCGRRPT